MTTFDEKFGAGFVGSLPTGPGVYRFANDEGVVLYVGKAKNLRRRLANYRNATRKRVHRKLRVLVREATRLFYETCESEQAALLREVELIRELQPHYNVDGAFTFLYPSIGIGTRNRTTLLCFTTQPEAFAALNLNWYGCFRSRPRTKAAFLALVDALMLVAHREKRGQLPAHPVLKGSVFLGLRQVPSELVLALPAFLAGEHMGFAAKLSLQLLSKPRALHNAAEVQRGLNALAHFFEADAARLHRALQLLGLGRVHVEQAELDAVLIRARAKKHADVT